MSRKTVLWYITVFFGASIVYWQVQSITKDSSGAVQLGAQVAALVLMIAAAVIFVRRQQ